MNEVNKLLRIITSALTVAFFIFLCWACIDIWRDGSLNAVSDSSAFASEIFSREAVSLRLRIIVPFLPIYILFIFMTGFYTQREKNDGAKTDRGNRICLAKKQPDLLSNMVRREVRKRSSCSIAIEVLRIFFLGLSVFLLVYGILGGGTTNIFSKAVKICTECIGLG